MESQKAHLLIKKHLQLAYAASQKEGITFKIPAIQHLRKASRKMHWHTNPEIFIQMEGTAQFLFHNESILLNPGEVCIMPRGVPHGEIGFSEISRNIVIVSTEKNMNIHIGRASYQEVARIEKFFPYDDENIHRSTEYIDDIISYYFSEITEKKAITKNLFFVFLHHILTILNQEKKENKNTNTKIYHCKRIINTHLYDKNMDVPFIAKLLECSPDYLSHIFQKETGVHLIHYLQKQRIQLACQLLKRSTLNINQIASETGFQNANYFIKVFKKITQTTPKKYRNEINQ